MKLIPKIINPVILFLLFNIIAPREVSLYSEYLLLNQIKFVNIGSSHSRSAFDYTDYPDSINLGLGSQRLHYGMMLLESIENKLDRQSTVIIPISIFSFCGQYDGPKQRYLGFLTREELEITYEEELLEKYFPYFGINKTELLFTQSTNFTQDFIDNGIDRAKYHISIAYECNIVDESVVEKIRRFVERNADKRIIFIITPYYQSYWKPILEEVIVISKVYETILDIVNEYDLEFYDYSNDYRFHKSISLFSDSDHMNNFGAKRFTKLFIEDIEEIKWN